MNRLAGLYPQYQISQDRRQQNIPVATDRRSGKDRRSEDRVILDKQLTKDIFEVKSRVAKLEAVAPGLFTGRVNAQAPTFAAKNNMTEDRLHKESKPDPSEIARREAKLQNKASTAFQAGVITAALGAAIAVSFMGPAGAVIAVGSAVYIGARVLKAMIVKELNETSDKKPEQK